MAPRTITAESLRLLPNHFEPQLAVMLGPYDTYILSGAECKLTTPGRMCRALIELGAQALDSDEAQCASRVRYVRVENGKWIVGTPRQRRILPVGLRRSYAPDVADWTRAWAPWLLDEPVPADRVRVRATVPPLQWQFEMSFHDQLDLSSVRVRVDYPGSKPPELLFNIGNVSSAGFVCWGPEWSPRSVVNFDAMEALFYSLEFNSDYQQPVLWDANSRPGNFGLTKPTSDGTFWLPERILISPQSFTRR